jgi:hypothetical protein
MLPLLHGCGDALFSACRLGNSATLSRQQTPLQHPDRRLVASISQSQSSPVWSTLTPSAGLDGPHPDVSEVLLAKLAKLKTHAQNFKLTFTRPQVYRISNAVDRLMNYQDRIL